MHLVVGASGSLGSHIALRLIKSGQPVRALVRESSKYSQLQGAGAEIALGDLTNPRSLERACMGVSRIVATATAAARGGKDTIETVDEQGYDNLITAAKSAGIKQFVFVSAHGFEEDSPSALARAKVRTESTLKASSIDYTILRPALFMESWIGQIIGAQLQVGKKVVVMGDPQHPLPFVSAANVADLAIAVLGNEGALRSSISLGSQMASYRQITDWIAQVTGESIELTSVPAGTAIPGLPPVIIDLWTLLSSARIPPLESVGVALNYGLSLEGVESFVRRTFGAASSRS